MAPESDKRFASLSNDPKYRLPSTKNARVQVDKRFSRMFKDADFNRKAKVDRYGRKLPKDNDAKLLHKLYRTDEGAKQSPQEEPASDSEDEDDESDAAPEQALDATVKPVAGTKRDLAREGFDESSSSDDSSEEEDESTAVDVEAELPEQQSDAQVPMGDASSRLAVVNLDWDNIRAVDIFAVAQSFTPSGTGITDVKVFPSEFGKERIERESLDGPPREIFAAAKSARMEEEEADAEAASDEDEDTRIKNKLLKADDGKDFDSASLRAYQLQRLRYYYAVITCGSVTTSQALYDAMDGREYLSTANFFDMRFIPDEVDFDDSPRDECNALPAGYKPNEFVTEALTHSKVKLTWDNDDTTRKEVQKRAFSRAEIDENDIQAYIGGSDSDSDDLAAPDSATDEAGSAPKLSKAEAQRQAMRRALGLSNGPGASGSSSSAVKQKGPAGDMEITFSSGLASKPDSNGKDKNSVFANQPVKDETTLEAYVRKEKERKARRKEKAKLARSSGADPVDDDVSDAEADPDTGDAAATEPVVEDRGFDDPFFGSDPKEAQAAERALKKAARAKKRAERAKEEAIAASERVELEKLITTADGDDEARHFDMNEIRKREKAAERAQKGKGKKIKQKVRDRRIDLDETVDGAANGKEDVQENFAIETQDPRFRGLFDSHEYAIDPTNPRYSGTKGMKALLEEGRKKRKTGPDDDAPGAHDETDKRENQSKKRKGEEVDVKRLIAKVKKHKSKA